MKRYIIFEDVGLDVSLSEIGGMQSWAKTTENRQKSNEKIREINWSYLFLQQLDNF